MEDRAAYFGPKTPFLAPLAGKGDFNEIFFHSEKVSDPPKSQACIDSFRSSFIDNGLFTTILGAIIRRTVL